MKKYKIITYGCQMNENDSEKISGMLKNMGYETETDPSKCDVIVMNTCSVRENADDHFFGNLGDLKAIKKKNPELIIATCGCMMQQQRIVDKINKKYPFVDIIFGTHNIYKFPELLHERIAHNERVQEIIKDTDYIPEDLPIDRMYSHKAFVSVTYGCDKFCSYCIVPYTRGREKSREPGNIISEVKCAVLNGAKEVMLLGQNVDSYGKGLSEKCDFADLLDKCSEIEGLERIRFMTSHPKDFSDRIIDVIKSHDNICNSIHLALQSGSNAVLKDMHRMYTREDYMGIVDRIRGSIPDVSITTDIIVGYPNETEEDFEQTLDIVNYCRFESAFTFIYSPREGTRAAKLPQINSKEVINNRFDRLLKLQHSIMDINAAKYEGQTVEVMIDGVSKNNKEMLTGRTKNNMLVHFTGKGNPGDIVDITVTKPTTFYLYGEMI